MTIGNVFGAELAMESATTRRVLERVPGEHFDWRPHERSSTLGQLALHVATLPQMLTEFVAGNRLDMAGLDFRQPSPPSPSDLLDRFDASVRAAGAYLAELSDDRAQEAWTLAHGSADLMTAPRAAAIRSFLFNHLYHHRGQLLVYLRLLNVPVPSVYGPTADENPFAAAG